MKRQVTTLVAIVLAAAVWSRADYVMNSQVESSPSQNQTAIGGGYATGGSSNADSDSASTSAAVATGGSAEGGSAVSWSNSQGGSGVGYSTSNLSLTTVTNVKNRTAPTGTYPPYLPMWNHGGWGTLQAYFSNGPTNNDVVYQRKFETQNDEDMDELRGVLCAVPYETPLDWVGALCNGIGVIFGGPDNYHHGRGFEIANSVVRQRRVEGKPLIVFIDSYIDPQMLADNGYAYMGRISVEGKYERNWDEVYDAAVAEALPWDVDLVLISGGMKGVTVGSNLTMPSLGFGYSQTNYSISAGGGYATGITEPKGKAVLSASCYRFSPESQSRRQYPREVYERLRLRPKAAAAAPAPAPAATTPTANNATAPKTTTTAAASPQQNTQPAMAPKSKSPGIELSKELYQMAGFNTGAPIENVAVR